MQFLPALLVTICASGWKTEIQVYDILQPPVSQRHREWCCWLSDSDTPLICNICL